MRNFRIGIWIYFLGFPMKFLFAQDFLPHVQQDLPISPLKYDKVEYIYNSGFHSGNVGTNGNDIAYQGNIEYPNAEWLRLHFSAYNLGKNSHIIIRSLIDDSWQKLDVVNMMEWGSSSAYFNGNKVEIILHIDPRDENVFFEVIELSVGKRHGSHVISPKTEYPSLLSECTEGEDNNTCDTRIPSNASAIGRVLPCGGTAFLASNGSLITVGHCQGQIGTIQFNVPESNPNGSINHPPAQHQYAADASSIVYSNSGLGNDWAVFGVSRNPNTGLIPAEAQNGFFRLKDVNIPSHVQRPMRVTGFGVDHTPTGPGPVFVSPSLGSHCRNRYSQTQQTATGNTTINLQNYYRTVNIPISNGNSGSPLIDEVTGLAIGIQTHGYNQYTSGFLLFCGGHHQRFTRPAFISAIGGFPGSNTVYVDSAHPLSNENGTYFDPFSTIEDAIQSASNGGIVSIVKGHYPEALTIQVSSGTLTLEAPVGDVTISGSGGSKIVMSNLPIETEAEIRRFNLFGNYPNPFNPVTVIEYTLPDEVKVHLHIYDILGRHIVSLVEETQPPGTHQVRWDASRMASGIYIYRIQAGNFTETRKMVLIK